MSQNWTIDPVTKDYVMSQGAPLNTDDLTIPSYIRMATKRTQWLYAPDVNYGSDFYLIKKRRSDQDASFFESVAARALQPIVNDGRASNIDVTTTVLTRGGIGMKIFVTDARGKTQPSLIVPVGP